MQSSLKREPVTGFAAAFSSEGVAMRGNGKGAEFAWMVNGISRVRIIDLKFFVKTQ